MKSSKSQIKRRNFFKVVEINEIENMGSVEKDSKARI